MTTHRKASSSERQDEQVANPSAGGGGGGGGILISIHLFLVSFFLSFSFRVSFSFFLRVFLKEETTTMTKPIAIELVKFS